LFRFETIFENVANNTSILRCVLRNFSEIWNVSSNAFRWCELEDVSSRMQNVVSVFIVKIKLKIDLIEIGGALLY